MCCEDGYGKGWKKLNLMIHEDGTIHCVGGDREEGEGDQPYLGTKILEREWGIQLSRCPRLVEVSNCAEKITEMVIKEICSRRGLRQEFESIDDDVKKEFKTLLKNEIMHLVTKYSRIEFKDDKKLECYASCKYDKEGMIMTVPPECWKKYDKKLTAKTCRVYERSSKC